MDPLPPFPWIDVVIIVVLFALNGVFAMSELALVSSRRARLEAMAKGRSRGASAALALSEDPGKFLSTVQIGITLIGILTGAYSGASLGAPTGARLALIGVPADIADTAGFALVIVITTFLSLIIGELVPKQFALRSPEVISAWIAIPMRLLATVCAPFVWLLDSTTGLVFKLLGLSREAENRVTAEELHLIATEAAKSGVIEEHERSIISGVVRLADRPVREIMTPRTEVDWLDLSLPEAAVRETLLHTAHTRLPVAEGSIDTVLGVVQARDVVAALIAGQAIDLRALAKQAPVLPDQVDAMDALALLRGAEVPMGFVHDEYGHFEGIVTPANLLAAIAGDARGRDDAADDRVVTREDGSLLVSGQMPADALAEWIGIELPEDRDYATVAGLALAVLKHLPTEGESFIEQGWRFEIVDMDGRKIDKLLVGKQP
ncbi:DNA-binding protein [Sphingomonas spermidinifaciens]|uniref:DNA-binding protein n=1 Tax=Sphingomonas spermidinifaciens TaxID=1141889 RepID=A0A2A4B666_9SPHN|nr:hemolysin family protein [Sphingomonas spermidinifaciens]PCD03258.1 DNA-binding protein [Sphingomonas spermidinifaciens]